MSSLYDKMQGTSLESPKKYDRLELRLPLGSKSVIQRHAKLIGESMNGYVSRIIKEATGLIENDYSELYDKYCLYLQYNEEQMRLAVLIEGYELEYFEDMKFEPNSIVDDFIKFEYNNEQTYSYDDFDISLDKGYYRYYVEKLDGPAGIAYTKERKIVIDSDYAEDKGTILHEMIHAYEALINKYWPVFHDILLISLYNDLKIRIDDLDARILNHTHSISQVRITEQGGSHDLLFFLKSLDLDLRCGYKFGTVCGYGRDEFSL